MLHVDAACLAGAARLARPNGRKERGAIEQEVARDLSNATYKFITRLNEDMFAGTPYAHDALGTKPSFDATTGDDAASVLPHLVCPEQRDSGNNRRRRSSKACSQK